MLDLYDELQRIARVLEAAGVEYALAGGLAVSIHARPRATDDIDVLVPGASLARVAGLLAGEGYEVRSEPLAVAKGRLRIQRLLKIAGDDLMLVDLLLADDAELSGMLERRVALGEPGERLWVVSLADLRKLKRLRGSPQDLADLDALGAEEDA